MYTQSYLSASISLLPHRPFNSISSYLTCSFSFFHPMSKITFNSSENIYIALCDSILYEVHLQRYINDDKLNICKWWSRFCNTWHKFGIHCGTWANRNLNWYGQIYQYRTVSCAMFEKKLTSFAGPHTKELYIIETILIQYSEWYKYVISTDNKTL